jgi:hypothetical protein
MAFCSAFGREMRQPTSCRSGSGTILSDILRWFTVQRTKIGVPHPGEIAMIAIVLPAASATWVATSSDAHVVAATLYQAVVNVDLVGIVAKRLADAHEPELTRWHKVLNQDYRSVAG